MPSTITNPHTQPYANTTISSAALSSGSGLTYTQGTNTTWAAPGNYTNVGAVAAADFILDGVSLKSILEQRLNMLVPNPALEREWEQLKKLGDEYRELEADLKEKARIWQALKKKS